MYYIEINNTYFLNFWILYTGYGFHIYSDIQGLRECEEFKHGKFNLIMGNRLKLVVTRIGVDKIMFDNSVRVDLNNCCYLSEMICNIISFHTLFRHVIVMVLTMMMVQFSLHK